MLQRMAQLAHHASAPRSEPRSQGLQSLQGAVRCSISRSTFSEDLPKACFFSFAMRRRRVWISWSWARIVADIRAFSACKAKSAIAREALDRIGALYDIEREITGRPADIRLAARQKHSVPKVDAFFAWAESQLALIPGKGDLAKAFRYGLSRRASFSLFLEDGRVAIDNNPAERALRPIGIGRKNWLFAGADTGAETLARAMTVIETAKLNSLDPQAYLADILARIHDHKINRLDELLPWNWSPLAAPNAEAA